MPLYECPKCGVVENTAVGFYWPAESGADVACSECHYGTWHGRFPRAQASDGWVAESPQHGTPGKPKFITRQSSKGKT
jgi:hypothetical protein